MCNFEYTKEITKEEIEIAMLMPGEYKIKDDKYYIPNIPGFQDGYICPCTIINPYIDGKNIIIKKEEYEYLKERDLKLTSLEHAGVDNWEGYDYSIDVLEELKKERL